MRDKENTRRNARLYLSYYTLASTLKYMFIIVLSLLLPGFVFADGRTNEPSHQTLFSNVITSYVDANAVTVADAEGLRVTTGNVGIGTTSPGQKLSVEGSATANENIARFNNQGNFASRIWLRQSSRSAYFSVSGGTADDVATGLLPYALAFGLSGNPSPIQFFNGATATARVTIDTSGNIGIGVTNPGAKLEIRGAAELGGQFKITRDVQTNQGMEIYAGGASVVFQGINLASGDHNQFSFNSQNNAETVTRMFISQAGNVGIGTTNPGYPLEIRGANPTLYIKGDGAGVQTGGVRVQHTGNAWELRPHILGTGHFFNIYDVSAGTPRLTIRDDNGNVGIGTASPVSRLDLSGGADGTLGAITFAQGNDPVKASQIIGTSVNTNEKGLQFKTYHYAPQTPMTITSGGSVGIGTTNPGEKLDVSGTIRSSDPSTRRVDISGANRIVQFYGGPGDEFVIENAAIANDNNNIKLRINGVNVIYMNKLGNVGIGTTTPTSKLHVIGKATITGGVDPPYVSFSGESHKSIRRYAKDIEEHEKAMLFWNNESRRIEVYAIDEDRFYDINGGLIAE